MPGEDIPTYNFWDLLALDKLGHAFFFGIQSLFFVISFKKVSYYKELPTRPIYLAVVVTIIYGGILELIQGTVFAGRTGDVFDFIANTAGSLFGVLFFRIIYGRELTRTV